MLRPARLIFTIFLGIGVAMLVAAGYSYLHTREFVASAVAADGVVIANVWSTSSGRNRSAAAYPRVRFRTAAGREVTFVSGVGTNPPSYRAGESVEVLYDPGDPANARIHSFGSLYVLPLVFGILGTVFSLVGGIPFAWTRHVQGRDDWLRANGRRIQADFERVEINGAVRVNGQCPWRIVCQWLNPMTNQVHVFRSHNLWYDPASFITGKTMEVILDPGNPKRYLVETSFLPKLAE